MTLPIERASSTDFLANELKPPPSLNGRKCVSTGALGALESSDQSSLLPAIPEDPQPALTTSDDTALRSRSWWSYNNGDGPTGLGEIYSAAKTTGAFVMDIVAPRVTTPEDPILQSRSSMASTTTMMQFFNALKPKTPFEYSAYLTSIKFDVLTKEEVKSHLTNLKQTYDDETAKEMSWVLPLITSSHIVVIIIQGNRVLYYDSRGKSAEKRRNEHDLTVRDVASLAAEIFREGKETEFAENLKTHQWDLVNCGVFVSLFVYQTLVNGMSLSDFDCWITENPDMTAHRDFLFKLIKESKPAEPTTDAEESHSDDFDMESDAVYTEYVAPPKDDFDMN